MTEFAFAQTAWVLLPPLAAILLAILTRHVLLSLGVGAALGVLLLASGHPIDALSLLGGKFAGIAVKEGALNAWNLNILAFLLILGVMMAFIGRSGAAAAFADWAVARVKTRRQAQLMTTALVTVIFIDDYFHSLTAGNIARPVTDRMKIARAKLAFLLDSTAAPVCVIVPLSSWGAYIIALIGDTLAKHGAGAQSPLSAFLASVPMNFYAVTAIVLAVCVAAFRLDIGPMKKAEAEAMAMEDRAEEAARGHGTMMDLLAPILLLISATVAAIFYTGYSAMVAAGKSVSILGMLESTDVPASLVTGGLIGLAASVALAVRHGLPVSEFGRTLLTGARGMAPAILILIFAWVLSSTVGDLGTGRYLAGLAEGNVSPAVLPALLFILAGFMAFATGTSWGTFGIMLPLAADMAVAVDAALMLPLFGAVLAGSVFGDHCSPISDTTILSATGAGCSLMDHVVTQLPYALTAAAVSLVGYLVWGFTASLMTGWVVAAILLALIVGTIHFRNSRNVTQ
ncbi:Na+/H+ antiporter NhaC family protein [Chitinibacteraceae bacterium HSL-7]